MRRPIKGFLPPVTNFSDLGLHKQVLKAVHKLGYETPTPIQEQAIPALLKGRDLMGIAQTGTGKTAAFALPTLDRLAHSATNRQPKRCRVLILSPTRELAGQISESFREYSQFMDCVTQCVFGGVKINRQIRNLGKGCHVLVATPGRLVDLMEQGAVKLDRVDTLILDEADQMLDMGFIHQLRKIMSDVPKARQTLLFSATMPKPIEKLANEYLNEPVRVSVAPESTTAERVNQGVLHVANGNKLKVLQALLKDSTVDRALVFARTKHGADKIVRKLLATQVNAMAIHGNKSQPQRKKALDAFKAGTCRVLVATDIAARGIDIDGITHVINFELPNVAEQYVHRIGRTARAGRDGIAISLVSEEDRYYLREIEKITRMDIDVLVAPKGCEDILLAEPDPSERPRKPKGPSQRQTRSRRRPSSKPNRSRNQKPAAKKTADKPAQNNKKHKRPGRNKRKARASAKG